MKKVLALSLLAAGVVAAAAAQTTQTQAQSGAQAAASPELKQGDIDMQRMNEALTKKRRELFAAGMGGLTPEQQEKFWKIYGDFEKEKDALGSARLQLLQQYMKNFSTLSDADIVKMANAANDIQKQSADLRMKYFGIINQQLGAKAAGRFYHIDDYLTTLLRLSILDNMPALQVGQ
jgi:hypothetical protein